MIRAATLGADAHRTSPALRQALEPVRAALLRDAGAEAEAIVTSAAESAETHLANVGTETDTEVARARSRAELSARAQGDQVRARLRSAARVSVLDAKRTLQQRLVDELHRSARQMRHDPRYPMLLDRLEAVAREQLGPEVIIDRDPPDGGGITARAGARRVDYRLDALADRALETLGDRVAQLWE